MHNISNQHNSVGRRCGRIATVELASTSIDENLLFCQINDPHLMPFLPFGEEILFQYLKRVISHFIIGNDQAFASDRSV